MITDRDRWSDRMLYAGKHVDHDRQPSRRARMSLVDSVPDDYLEAPDRIVGEAA